MKETFADTSYFVAVLSAHDEHHKLALKVGGALNTPLVTTFAVLLELGNALAASRLRGQFEVTLAQLKRDPNVEIVPPSLELFDLGCQFYSDRPDKEWSLTDCISFIVMNERALTNALTTDHHFQQAGFRALLRA